MTVDPKPRMAFRLDDIYNADLARRHAWVADWRTRVLVGPTGRVEPDVPRSSLCTSRVSARGR